MQSITLHQLHDSGNSYKVRLTASLLSIKQLHLKDYSILDGETRTPEFLNAVNPNGKLPVLQIGHDIFLPESGAAIYYLADKSPLIPSDRLEHAEMLQWMFFEQYSHEPYIATLRFYAHMIGLENLSEEQKASVPNRRKAGAEALDVMERHLSTRKFFVAEKMTLADVALYAYTHVAHDSTFFDLKDWPNVKEWCARIAKLPGYISIEE